MTMFLVKGSVRYTPYMGDTTVFDDMRLVIAADAAEAERKYEAWWGSKSKEYSRSYFATGEALETLGSPEPEA